MFTPFAFFQNAVVTAAAPASFTGYYIGGLFTTYASSSQPYFRMLDSTGYVSSSANFNTGIGFNNNVYTVATQSDGKIIAGGTFTTYSGSTAAVRIARLNTNGTLDSTFNVGTTGANALIYTTAVQADDKVIIGGSFTTYSGSGATRIARINTNGTIDTGSSWNTGAGLDNVPLQLLVQPDQKIVAVGNFIAYSGSTKNRIARINTDGTADTGSSWNSGTGFNNSINSVAIQSDGKLIAVGASNTTYSGSSATRIARINTNGTIDSTFNIGAGLNSVGYTVVVQSDDKIIVGGGFTAYSSSTANDIVRINTNGSIDNTFNTGTGFDGLVYSLAIQPDGKIIAQGTFSSYSGSIVGGIVRLNTNGSIDTTFNRDMSINSAQQNTATLPLSNGSIIIGGAYIGYRNAWMNFLDSSGGVTSKSSIATYLNGSVYTAVSQSDGKLLVGGGFTTYSGSRASSIARINTDGTIDTSPTWNTGTGFNSTVYTIAVQSDGKMVLGGVFTSYSGSNQNRIIRLNADGTRDTTFNQGTTGASNPVNALALQSDGKIIAAGAFTTYSGSTKNYIARINTDGTADTGSSWNQGVGLGTTANTVIVQPDQKIVVGGAFTTYSGSTKNYIARINTDGTADTGSSWNQGVGFNNGVNSITIQSDGKLIVGGNFTSYSGSASNNTRIIRLNSDGTKDTVFNSGAGFNGVVSSIAIEPGTSKILAVGQFTTYSGSTVGRAIRLNTNGSIDNTFTPVSGGFNGTVNVVIPY